MPWTIYKHTHVASGRCYVGLTTTPEERRARSRKGKESMTADQRSEHMRKAWTTRRARMTPEKAAAMTEVMRNAAAKFHATVTAEERSAAAKKSWETRRAQGNEWALRAWATRRANAAAAAAACPAPSLRFNLLAPRVQPAAVAPTVPAVLPAPPVLPEPSRPLVQLPLFAA